MRYACSKFSIGGYSATYGYIGSPLKSICSSRGEAYVCKVSRLRLKQGLRYARSKFSIGRYSGTYGCIFSGLEQPLRTGFSEPSLSSMIHVSTEFDANQTYPRGSLEQTGPTNRPMDNSFCTKIHLFCARRGKCVQSFMTLAQTGHEICTFKVFN